MSKEKFTKTIELVTELYAENEKLKRHINNDAKDVPIAYHDHKTDVRVETLSRVVKDHVRKVWFESWSFPNIEFDGEKFNVTEEEIIKHIHEYHSHIFLSDNIANSVVYGIIDPIVLEAYKELCEVIKSEWKEENEEEN